jgi:hypothetical protein
MRKAGIHEFPGQPVVEKLSALGQNVISAKAGVQ